MFYYEDNGQYILDSCIDDRYFSLILNIEYKELY